MLTEVALLGSAHSPPEGLIFDGVGPTKRGLMGPRDTSAVGTRAKVASGLGGGEGNRGRGITAAAGRGLGWDLGGPHPSHPSSLRFGDPSTLVGLGVVSTSDVVELGAVSLVVASGPRRLVEGDLRRGVLGRRVRGGDLGDEVMGYRWR